MEQGIARRIRVGAVRPKAADAPRAIARPLSCLQAKQPADVDDHREGIVRPIASKSAIALTPRIPHS